ncbi:MAG: DUF302 domain-containing protein [Bacteroidales bacterium]|nr:DUF302 domain-containing protein [Bacteroidales bacterium]
MKKKIFYFATLALSVLLITGSPVKAQKRNQNKDTYYFFKVVNITFDEAVVRVKETLKEQGFGVVSETNMQEKITKATGKEMNPYLILGACNPHGAYEALQIDGHIGLLLPCNVIVRDLGNDRIEVAAIDPNKSMQTADNPKLKPLAKEVGEKLKLAIANI